MDPRSDPRNPGPARDLPVDEPEPDAATDPTTGLSLRVLEQGPDLPWKLRVINTGSHTVQVAADPRLLWFEVRAPGRRKPSVCRLPSELFPEDTERRLLVELEPGEGIADEFDPRLYCFAVSGQTALVPGALVEAHFGWPNAKPRTVWRRGKREQEPVRQKPPFVAQLTDNEERVAAGNTAVRELGTETFALQSAYAEWSKARLEPSRPDGDKDAPLSMVIVQGSDAQAERNATIQLKLRNNSDRELAVYFRRELVSFEVTGSAGVTSCQAAPEFRAPDPMSFLTIAPGRSTTITCELAELCPPGTFAAPGLYLVHARFEAKDDEEASQRRAYTGSVVSPEPGIVRIRTGDIPFVSKHSMRVVGPRGRVRFVPGHNDQQRPGGRGLHHQRHKHHGR